MSSLPRLSRAVLSPADAQLLKLPVRALQFGTGAFLRGFVDHFLDAANRAGAFGGRVIAVASTGSSRDAVLAEQDGLYSLLTRGLSDGVLVEEARVITSVDRAISAQDDWTAVLACARIPTLAFIFSNTTEVGIALDDADRYTDAPARSYPGKLVQFLVERAQAFGNTAASAPIVVPCELIEGNGARLRELVLLQCARWNVDASTVAWVREHVRFCNTLVDRIVPGTPEREERRALEEHLGWRDALLTTCEPYRLFAIEGDDTLRARLPFASADTGIVIAPDIAPFRERKVRLLNATHTLIVPIALEVGCTTVSDALAHPLVGEFTRRLLLDELVGTFRQGAERDAAASFARQVLDRFANPYIRHALADITLQGTMKLRVRVLPSVRAALSADGIVPPLVTFAFAAFMWFMRGAWHEQRRAAGHAAADDASAAAWTSFWSRDTADAESLHALVRDVLADRRMWDEDLSVHVPLLVGVEGALRAIVARGVSDALDEALAATRSTA